MDIEINGKEYSFNNDIRFGVLIKIQEDPENLKHMQVFLKEILLPTPTKKEVYNFRESDLINISQKFEEFQKRKTAEAKKKLSR